MLIPTSDRLLHFMEKEGYRPLSFRELVYQLGVSRGEREGFKGLVNDMMTTTMIL